MIVPALLGALVAAHTNCLAQVVFSNQAISTGIHAYSDVDVTITDCWVTGSSGGTVIIVVSGGSLTVNGFNGAGVDGTDGTSVGYACPGYGLPTPGTAGTDGYCFAFSTAPSSSRPNVSLDISIGCLGVTAVGGAGGGGGSGGDAAGGVDGPNPCPTEHCNDVYDAQPGNDGAPGAKGGSVTILSSGAIIIGGKIDTSGGDGGAGGGGGDSGLPGTSGPEAAKNGCPGGKAGDINIQHTTLAAANALCNLVVIDNDCYGELKGDGGDGGSGGDGGGGGVPGSGPKAGGDGAIGGAGATIYFNVHRFSQAASCGVSARGGLGGAGGRGGSGNDFDCPECHEDGLPIIKYPGFIGWKGQPGGLGGDGGAGGSVTYIASNTAVFAGGSTWSCGGDGASAGLTGNSGFLASTPCEPECPDGRSASPGADGNASGSGGTSGDITITIPAYLVSTGTLFNTEGGDGASGVLGGKGKPLCCNDVLWARGIGGIGGAGGTGGNGGNVVITGTRVGSVPTYWTCGGRGGDGGSGQIDSGPGHAGATGGTAGGVSDNLTWSYPSTCPGNGNSGSTGPLGSCGGN
jgi:hypothetical protein